MATNNHLIEIRPGRRLTIFYSKHPNSSKTLFFCHGLGGRLGQWQGEIDCLKTSYSIVAFDLFGHGDSARPQKDFEVNCSFAEFANDILAILRRFGSAENSLIGHSYGGALTAHLALHTPELIKKIILINPISVPPELLLAKIFLFPIWLLNILQPLLTKNFTQMGFSPRVDRKMVAEEIVNLNKNSMYVIKAMEAGIKNIPHEDWTQLQQPALLILSPNDRVLPAKKAEKMYGVIPNIQIEHVDNTGHVIIMENADLVSQKIKNFIE